jgi:predicted HTH transcriptional regulator
MDKVLAKALTSSRESKTIEFKEAFDVSSAGDWCELIKDIVALANSGGGVILIGVDNRGSSNAFNVGPFLNIDPADITNKVHKYSGIQFSDFEITEEIKGAHKVGALRLQGVSIPTVFTKPGTYEIGGGKQRTAFKEGAVYFRHGAKSEPGNSEDIRRGH